MTGRAAPAPPGLWERLQAARLPAVPGSSREVWPWWLFLFGALLVLPLHLSMPDAPEVLPLLRAVAFAAAVLLARWYPGVALCATVVLQLPLPGHGGAPPPWFLDTVVAQVVVTLAGTAALGGRLAVSLTALVVACGAVRALVAVQTGQWTLQLTGPLALWAAGVVLACAVGLRRHDRVRTALARLAETRRRQVHEERERIGRELHDVVAHHLSVLAVRAASAARRVPEVSAPAAAEFDEIATLSRTALGDMRRLVGVLHGRGESERHPQPGLADLPGLVEATRGAGCAIEVTTTGDVDDVLGVSVYRIVQEALANAVRHATGADVRIRVDAAGAGPVRVSVENGRPPAAPVSAPGAGSGLRGMGERARLLGGTFEAGPTPDGGFSVRATLPREAT